jgi:hypothetical protein
VLYKRADRTGRGLFRRSPAEGQGAVVPYDPPVRRVLFITLGALAVLGIGLVLAVTATGDVPSSRVIWAALGGTLAALLIVLVLEYGPSASSND